MSYRKNPAPENKQKFKNAESNTKNGQRITAAFAKAEERRKAFCESAAYIGNQVSKYSDAIVNIATGVGNYLGKSLNQVVLGNFTEDVTALGTGLQVVAGIANVDLPMDIRDIGADFVNWEWSWGHVGTTALDLVGLIPIVGAVKYGDEAVDLLKHTDEASDVLKHSDEAIKGVAEPELPGRNGALNQAKKDGGIPRSSQPDYVEHVPMREPEYSGGHVMKDDDGNVIYTREYNYTNSAGEHVVIQEHSAPHIGADDPHFNVRPITDTRHGVFPGTKKHYPFKK